MEYISNIETERTMLRQFKIEDIDDVFEYASDIDVTQYLTWNPHKDRLETKKYLEDTMNMYKKENNPLAIVWKEKNKVIGCIDGRGYDKRLKSIEVGYVLNRKYWNKGIMTEVLGRMLEYWFDKFDLERIEMRHYEENEASGKVMKKNGFKYEGTLRKKEERDGKFYDVRYYSLLKEEYLSR